jgi:hypothetical protein
MNQENNDTKYLSVSGELEELKSSSNSAKEKAFAGAAIVGKSIFNFGKFLLKEGPPVLERMNKNMQERIETEKRRRGE